MRIRVLALLLASASSSVLGCKTLSEVSIGYADAITTSSLPSDGSWSQASVAFPGLTDMDPLSSPSLSRYAVTPEEVESVKVTSVELEGPAGECGLPFLMVQLQLVSAELGPTPLARALRDGDCQRWTLTSDDLAPWFRQPKVSIIALVDGQPVADAQSISLRVSFIVDVKDKRIE